MTMMRLLAVVPLVWLIDDRAFLPAFYLFLIAALSDAFDGIIARATGGSSTIGAALDPLADKTLIAGGLVALWWVALVPGWFILLLVIRDLAILASSAALFATRRTVRIEPLAAGKVATALQLFLVGFVLLEEAFTLTLAGLVEIGFPVVAVVAWVSLALTAWDAWRVNGAQGASTA